MKVITDKYKEMGKMSLHEAQVFYIYCALLLLLASLTSTRRWARWVCTSAGILYILCPPIIAGITDKYKEMGKVGLHEAQVFFIYCALLLLLASLTVQGDGQDDPA